MENLHDLMVNRRSIRRYTSEPIVAEEVKTIMEAALMAPTSKNSRPWQFVLVDDPQKLDELSQCKEHGAGPVKNCSLAIVVCADSRITDTWIEDASIAAAFIQLQVADLGLGSCWIQIRGRYRADGQSAEEFLCHALNIPEEINPLCIITVGHKDEERKPANLDKLMWEKVHVEQWS